jgi:TPR repeat protein
MMRVHCSRPFSSTYFGIEPRLRFDQNRKPLHDTPIHIRSISCPLALSWFTKAAELDHPQATNMLGVLAKEAGDMTLAKSWYTRAAGLGDKNAAENLQKLD